ncbi:MAG: hypothetical protein HRT68_02220 [Flavobacteriaceae bacterium]|nr:hypothetical protein [Flavobacteriaceae bacterium]
MRDCLQYYYQETHLKNMDVCNGNISNLEYFCTESLHPNAIICLGNIFDVPNNLSIDPSTTLSMCFDRPFSQKAI